MMLLALDPDTKECGCALVDERARLLLRVGVAPYTNVRGFLCASYVHTVVVERPAYQGARSDAARTQDLIALAWAGGAAAYSLGVPVVEQDTPHEPKPTRLWRMWDDTLTPAERSLFPAGTGAMLERVAEAHALGKRGGYPRKQDSTIDMLDAAWHGLVYVGRIKR